MLAVGMEYTNTTMSDNVVDKDCQIDEVFVGDGL